MENGSELVTSVFGKMTRRELIKRLAMTGLALGVTGSEIIQGLGNPPAGDAMPPPIPIGGTPFREITRYQTFTDELFDIQALQRSGTPRRRTRDTSWFHKPANAVGVSLLQFTNTPKAPLNSCAQAACATVLNFYKKAPDGLAGDAITDKIYTEYPPDGGERGTSFRRTIAIMEAYGMKTWSGRSNEHGADVMVERLKGYVAQGRPVTVLLDLKKPQGISGTGMLGHFVVVLAYTDTHVFMTNWNNKWKNDWDTFKVAWSLPEAQNHHLMAVGWA